MPKKMENRDDVGIIMKVNPEFKRIVKEKAEKDGKAMTDITKKIAKRIEGIL